MAAVRGAVAERELELVDLRRRNPNVSILLLARGSARENELAVRAAIGAGRFRILTQLLIESLSLSIAGASLGILLAYRTLGLLGAWLPEGSFPNEAAVEINLPVLLFSIGLALLTGIVFGLSPAWPRCLLSPRLPPAFFRHVARLRSIR